VFIGAVCIIASSQQVMGISGGLAIKLKVIFDKLINENSREES
jgi:hypothetical protein